MQILKFANLRKSKSLNTAFQKRRFGILRSFDLEHFFRASRMDAFCLRRFYNFIEENISRSLGKV